MELTKGGKQAGVLIALALFFLFLYFNGNRLSLQSIIPLQQGDMIVECAEYKTSAGGTSGWSKWCLTEGEVAVPTVLFSCESNWERCEVYDTGSGAGSKENLPCPYPSTPNLVKVCVPGSDCRYDAAKTRCFISYKIASTAPTQTTTQTQGTETVTVTQTGTTNGTTTIVTSVITVSPPLPECGSVCQYFQNVIPRAKDLWQDFWLFIYCLFGRCS